MQVYVDGQTRPEMLAFDRHGALFFTAFTFGKVYKIDAERNVSLFVDGTEETDIRGIAFDDNGDLYACGDPRGVIYKITGPRFVRGECNGDSEVDLADAVCSLDKLFLSGAADFECAAAFNVNGDNSVDISDPIALLNFLFVTDAFPTPAEPFPDCGPETLAVDNELGCESRPSRCQ